MAIAILLLEAPPGTCYEAEGIIVLPAVKKLNASYFITFDQLQNMGSRTIKDPQTAQEATDLLSEDPSPAVFDAGASWFAAQWIPGEEFLEKFPLRQGAQSGNETFTADSLAQMMPSVAMFPGFPDPPGKHNPLPLEAADVYMQDAPEEEQHPRWVSITLNRAISQIHLPPMLLPRLLLPSHNPPLERVFRIGIPPQPHDLVLIPRHPQRSQHAVPPIDPLCPLP
ncbi:hypothetical protein PSPO01_16297 [Paraphaeosphaeria sporulosa]